MIFIVNQSSKFEKFILNIKNIKLTFPRLSAFNRQNLFQKVQILTVE